MKSDKDVTKMKRVTFFSETQCSYGLLYLRLTFRLSVCLSVVRITQKLMKMERILTKFADTVNDCVRREDGQTESP